MKSFANWMTTIFMIMFWGFRIMVVYMAGKGNAFIVTPINYTAEVVLLFITLFCIILVMKRIIWGGIIHAISYLAYFGVDLYNKLMPVFKGESISANVGLDMFISVLGIVLALIVMIDLATDYAKKPVQKNTDWFFENNNLNRNSDDREDHNNYRIY